MPKKNKVTENEIIALSKVRSPITGRPGIVTCPVCKGRVGTKNIVGHYNKQHAGGMSKEDQSLLRREVYNNKRRALPDKDFDKLSKDVFDRGKVVQGGAFGLGKKRKH